MMTTNHEFGELVNVTRLTIGQKKKTIGFLHKDILWSLISSYIIQEKSVQLPDLTVQAFQYG